MVLLAKDNATGELVAVKQMVRQQAAPAPAPASLAAASQACTRMPA
jgi:hypothetical protein